MMRRLQVHSMTLLLIAGCGGDAGVELAASDALSAVADQMQLTVQEYHGEVSRYDETREDATREDAMTTILRDEPRRTAVTSLHSAPAVEAFRQALTDGLIRVDTANRLLKLVNDLVVRLVP